MNGLFFFYLLFFVVAVAGLWKMFEKGHQAGWKAIIPIYNTIVLLELIGRPIWWVILLFVPIVNIVIWLIMCLDTAKSYGAGTGTAIGLFFLTPIFFIVLGFGSNDYRGPAVATT